MKKNKGVVISLFIIIIILAAAIGVVSVMIIKEKKTKTEKSHEMDIAVIGQSEEITTEESTEESTEDKTLEAATNEKLPCDSAVEFSFSSGAGAWSTGVTINPDGTFTGGYSDADMGDIGDDYPYGTEYLCNFTGKFTDIKKIDEYTYSMKLESVETIEQPNEEQIKDGVRYIYSTPYGIEGGKTFYLYLPGTKVANLPQEFVTWIYGLAEKETLSGYGLYNVEMQEGFSGN